MTTPFHAWNVSVTPSVTRSKTSSKAPAIYQLLYLSYSPSCFLLLTSPQTLEAMFLLWVFAHAVPSAWNAFPHGAHMTDSLSTLQVFIKGSSQWNLPWPPIIATLRHPCHSSSLFLFIPFPVLFSSMALISNIILHTLLTFVNPSFLLCTPNVHFRVWAS